MTISAAQIKANPKDAEFYIEQMEAEIAKLKSERDEWKAKWLSLAQAAVILGGNQ